MTKVYSVEQYVGSIKKGTTDPRAGVSAIAQGILRFQTEVAENAQNYGRALLEVFGSEAPAGTTDAQLEVIISGATELAERGAIGEGTRQAFADIGYAGPRNNDQPA